MVLACEGKLVNAHKVIISSSSPVLKNILKHSPQNPFIYLTGVKYEDLKNIVTLIYQAKLPAPSESIPKPNEKGNDESDFENIKSEN